MHKEENSYFRMFFFLINREIKERSVSSTAAATLYRFFVIPTHANPINSHNFVLILYEYVILWLKYAEMLSRKQNPHG